MRRAHALLVLLRMAHGACPNACSGHGVCGEDSTCACFQGWLMPTCSERACPYDDAWVAAPDADTGATHAYAECAARGICDRATGECDCLRGFAGKACGYTSCPDDCSGHGTCEFVEDLPLGAVPRDYYDGWNTGFHTRRPRLALTTHEWGAGRLRACACDPTWTGVSCARRMCARGPDPLDQRAYAGHTLPQTQKLAFSFNVSAAYRNVHDAQSTFALTFVSHVDERYTTIPIVLNRFDTARTAADIAAALRALPNGVVDGVRVNATTASWPTPAPTAAPSPAPSPAPSAPSGAPTPVPTPANETGAPSTLPTALPTALPTTLPAPDPTSQPSPGPTTTTSAPTAAPTPPPSSAPTSMPSSAPTSTPTALPTSTPTATFAPTYEWEATQFDLTFEVTFDGEAVSGSQRLLVVDVASCGDGCTPQLDVVEVTSYAGSSVTEARSADLEVRPRPVPLSPFSQRFAELYEPCPVCAGLRVRPAREVQLRQRHLRVLRRLHGLQVPGDVRPGIGVNAVAHKITVKYNSAAP